MIGRAELIDCKLNCGRLESKSKFGLTIRANILDLSTRVFLRANSRRPSSGSRSTIRLLRNLSNLVRSGKIASDEFLEKVMAQTSHQGKFRILEVGGGTGSTTKYIVPHLQKLEVPFEYVFTDLLPSLVSAAKRTFKDCPETAFATLDIEKGPPADWGASFHVATVTNCIHATHDLTVSLTSLRRLLRLDSVLTSGEITCHMFWLDVAVRLFEGWWIMEDERTHAVTHQDW